MRVLALVAFIGLQLSMFTCGLDVHVDHLDVSTTQAGHVIHNGTQSGHSNSDHGSGHMDRVCQIHASHVFADQKLFSLGVADTASDRPLHLAQLAGVTVPTRIEHPPRVSRG
ncbi:MAG TPA: hypothetical protein VJ961_00625 [Mariprofundaceae bacterium]|nr:hypothetical protein [Mariprofundaceae bacterium]